METFPLISIIVPVYNVEKYIDQCLESISIQTYKNLEVIIVYDVSIDATLDKCQRWVEKDQRIVLLCNPNRGGLGAARNLGLRTAKGKYVVYVDSDDWIKDTYIEVLCNAIERTQANYVSSVGYYRVDSQDNINEVTSLPAGEYTRDSDKILVLLKDAPAVWKKIYDREWLMKNYLFQPELFHYEDWGFEIATVLSAEKIVLISEIGVFYRAEREDSLTANGYYNMAAVFLDFKKSTEFGLEQAGRLKVLNKYCKAIQKFFLHDYYLRRKKAIGAKDKKALHILEEMKSDILIKKLEYRDIDLYVRHICFGSFSLYSIVRQTFVFGRDLEYYGFSSIISALTKGNSIEVKNKNSFRIEQVSKDISGTFGTAIEAIKEKSVLFIDFLEERNQILMLDNNQYITENEAYMDSTIEKLSIIGKVPSGAIEFMLLWEEKCKSLIEMLKRKRDILEIILVKSRLSLQYGDFNELKKFEEKEKIIRINALICKLENCFLEQCKRNGIFVKVFDLPEEYCFTDVQFKYGCVPQYMNGALYTKLALEIFEWYESRGIN